MKDREARHTGGRRVGHNLATEQQLNKKLKAISHPYLLKKDKRSLLLELFGTGNNIKTARVGCHLHPAPCPQWLTRERLPAARRPPTPSSFFPQGRGRGEHRQPGWETRVCGLQPLNPDSGAWFLRSHPTYFQVYKDIDKSHVGTFMVNGSSASLEIRLFNPQTLL